MKDFKDACFHKKITHSLGVEEDYRNEFTLVFRLGWSPTFQVFTTNPNNYIPCDTSDAKRMLAWLQDAIPLMEKNDQKRIEEEKKQAQREKLLAQVRDIV